MTRGERRDRTRRKAKSRKHRLKNALGVSFSGSWSRRELNAEPDGKFRNNSIANEYTHYGCELKTNRKKGHSNYRRKGAYGVAMDWKPHDQRQIDQWEEDKRDNYKVEKPNREDTSND